MNNRFTLPPVSPCASLYKVPDSSVGKRLTQILTTKLRNVRLLKNTSEKLIVFILVILHRVRGITSYSDIRKHIFRQLKRNMNNRFTFPPVPPCASLYKVPDSSVGKRLTQILTTKLRNVRLLKNTPEKLIVFILEILHRVRGITSYSDIRKHIFRQLKRWEAGEYELLVQTTLTTLKSQLSFITKNKTLPCFPPKSS